MTAEWSDLPEPLADYRRRLSRAMWELNEMALDEDRPDERARLSGKAQGVALAIDYLQVLWTSR